MEASTIGWGVSLKILTTALLGDAKCWKPGDDLSLGPFLTVSSQNQREPPCDNQNQLAASIANVCCIHYGVKTELGNVKGNHAKRFCLIQLLILEASPSRQSLFLTRGPASLLN